MERLTESNPSWIDDELWERACEPDCEEIDAVYLSKAQRLRGLRGTGQTYQVTLQRSVHGIRRHSISYL